MASKVKKSKKVASTKQVVAATSLKAYVINEWFDRTIQLVGRTKPNLVPSQTAVLKVTQLGLRQEFFTSDGYLFQDNDLNIFGVLKK